MVATATPPRVELLRQIERDCRRHFDVACERLLWIKPKLDPLCLLSLNWAQRYLYQRYLKPAWAGGYPVALVVLKARRVGISTLMAAWLYHKIRWYSGQNALIAAHRDDTLDELHHMVHRFHTHLPPELRPPTDRLNRKELSYGRHDSRVRVLPALYKDISRGKTIQHALLTEVAQYPDPETIMSGLLEAIPNQGRTSLVLEGTAEGVDNYWHLLWQTLGKRREGSFLNRSWQRVFIPWFWDPAHRATVPVGLVLTEEEAALKRRFRLTDEQMSWYRLKGEELEQFHPGRGERILHQEYPSTPEEAFQAAGECLFPASAIAKQRLRVRAPEAGFQMIQIGTWSYQLDPCSIADASLLCWEPPRRDCQYAIGVDVSRGVGRDDSAVVVMRMPGFVQVAHWLSDYTDPRSLAFIVAAIARYYAGPGNRPIVCVEVNDAGIMVNAELQEIAATDVFDLYLWETFDRLAPPPATPASRTGWLTTAVSKPIMVGTANILLVGGVCEIPSSELLADMERTTEVLPGFYRTGGCDLTIALLLAMVTAWRKIARYAWPGIERLGPSAAMDASQPPPGVDPVRLDRRGQELLVGVGAGTGGYSMDRDWRLQ